MKYRPRWIHLFPRKSTCPSGRGYFIIWDILRSRKSLWTFVSVPRSQRNKETFADKVRVWDAWTFQWRNTKPYLQRKPVFSTSKSVYMMWHIWKTRCIVVPNESWTLVINFSFYLWPILGFAPCLQSHKPKLTSLKSSELITRSLFLCCRLDQKST